MATRAASPPAPVTVPLAMPLAAPLACDPGTAEAAAPPTAEVVGVSAADDGWLPAPAPSQSTSGPAASPSGTRHTRMARLRSVDTPFNPLASVSAGKRAPADRSVSSPAATPFDAQQPQRHAPPTVHSNLPATSLLHKALMREGLSASVSFHQNCEPLPSVDGPAQKETVTAAKTPADAAVAPGATGVEDECSASGAAEHAEHDVCAEDERGELTKAAKTAAAGAMAATIALAVAAGSIVSPEPSAGAGAEDSARAPTAAGTAPPAVASAAWAAAAAASAATMASVPASTVAPRANPATLAQAFGAATAAAHGGRSGQPPLSAGTRSLHPVVTLDVDESIVFSDGSPGLDDSEEDDGSMNSLTEELGVHVELSPPSDDGSPSSRGTQQAVPGASTAAQPQLIVPQPARRPSPSPSGGWVGWSSRSSQAELYRPGVVREGGAVCILDVRIETEGGWKSVQRPEMSVFGGADASVEAGVAKGIFHRLYPSRPVVKRSPRARGVQRAPSPQPLNVLRSPPVTSGAPPSHNSSVLVLACLLSPAHPPVRRCRISTRLCAAAEMLPRCLLHRFPASRRRQVNVPVSAARLCLENITYKVSHTPVVHACAISVTPHSEQPRSTEHPAKAARLRWSRYLQLRASLCQRLHFVSSS